MRIFQRGPRRVRARFGRNKSEAWAFVDSIAVLFPFFQPVDPASAVS